MKKILITAAVLFATVLCRADVKNPQDPLLVESMRLLINNAEKIELTGNIQKGESLKLILNDVENYYEDIFSLGQSEESSDVRDFSADCKIVAAKTTAKCFFTLEYKPLGETTVEYVVELDQNNKPIAILNNRAIVTRGE